MAFRTVCLRSRCKLEVELNYLVIRGEKNVRILMDEISTLIVASTQVSLTAAAISRLMDHHVKIIFCDGRWNPQGEVIPYAGNYNASGNLLEQIGWSKENKDILWKTIIKAKLTRQAYVLKKNSNLDMAKLLYEYIDSVVDGDATNREGLGAKVYFESLFGLGFQRRRDSDERNTFLNYGYSIILSAVSREIATAGYCLQLGIHHIGATNPFNLACDFVEPLRPLVDMYIVQNKVNKENFKKVFNSMLEAEVKIAGRTCFLDNAIKSYVNSLLGSLKDGDWSQIRMIRPIDDEQL